MENSTPSVPEDHQPSPELPAPPELLPPPPRENMFFGPHGLRAGWRLVIFFALFFAAAFALGLAWGLVMRHSGPRPQFSYVGVFGTEIVLFGAAVIASGVMAVVEKRSFADYGLPARGAFGARFWEGALWGFAALTLLLLALRLTGHFEFGSPALHGVKVLKYGALWAMAFLAVGFGEEYAFRGYPLATLASGIRFWPAAIALSLLFGAVHLGNSGENWLGGFNAGFIGLFFCLTLRRTGSLWFAIGAHLGWDWAETFFYGTPDSGQPAQGHFLTPSFHGSHWITGGSVGPEGSLLCVLIIVALFVVFDRRFPRKVATCRLPVSS